MFHALTKEHMKKIVGIMTKELQQRCREQLDLELKITDGVKQYIDVKHMIRNMVHAAASDDSGRNWRIRLRMSCYPEQSNREVP